MLRDFVVPLQGSLPKLPVTALTEQEVRFRQTDSTYEGDEAALQLPTEKAPQVPEGVP